jgi:hypothetical protein
VSRRYTAADTLEGDIVVTCVAGRYAIGRLTADAKTQSFLEVQSDRTVALARACTLVSGNHRVFLAHGTRYESVQVDCAEAQRQYANRPHDERLASPGGSRSTSD